MTMPLLTIVRVAEFKDRFGNDGVVLDNGRSIVPGQIWKFNESLDEPVAYRVTKVDPRLGGSLVTLECVCPRPEYKRTIKLGFGMFRSGIGGWSLYKAVEGRYEAVAPARRRAFGARA